MQKCVWMSMKGQGLSSLKAEDTYFVVFKSHYTIFFLNMPYNQETLVVQGCINFKNVRLM